jgi:hypothetical protein
MCVKGVKAGQKSKNPPPITSYLQHRRTARPSNQPGILPGMMLGALWMDTNKDARAFTRATGGKLPGFANFECTPQGGPGKYPSIQNLESFEKYLAAIFRIYCLVPNKICEIKQ